MTKNLIEKVTLFYKLSHPCTVKHFEKDKVNKLALKEDNMKDFYLLLG